MPRGNVYTLRHEAAVATAITILQLKAGTNSGFEILSAHLTQRDSETSVQESIGLVRKSAAATVTTAVAGTHLFEHLTDGPAADLSLGTTATGVIGTAEGTDGDIVLKEGFNALNGWHYVPVPEERHQFKQGEIVALKFLNAPASQNWEMAVTIREL